MKRRLFIAVDLDPQARRAVEKIETEIQDAFGREKGEHVRFVPDENWHITISFLGTQDDGSLTAILDAMQKVAKEVSAINLSFTEISYAPRKNDPRMIWIKTNEATSKELREVKNSLEHLLDAASVRFEHESRKFSGHITLARFLSTMPPSDLPPVERTIAISSTGASLDLMESELGRDGAKYTVLQKFPFSEN